MKSRKDLITNMSSSDYSSAEVSDERGRSRLVSLLGEEAMAAPVTDINHQPAIERRSLNELSALFDAVERVPHPLAQRSSDARRTVRDLHQLRRAGGEEAELARRALAQLARDIVAPYKHRPGTQPLTFALGSNLESLLSRVRDRVLPTAIREEFVARLGRQWSVLSFVATVLASILVVQGHLLQALLILTVRVAGSLVFFTPGLPADLSARTRFLRVSWAACVAGHLSDALMVSAIGALLLRSGQTAWGYVVVVVGLLVMTSTLARVAALQDGHWLPRLQIERILRSGGLAAGLLLAVMVQPDIPATGFPVIVVAASGALLFAIVESARTAHYEKPTAAPDDLDQDLDRFVERLAAIALAIDMDRTEDGSNAEEAA